MTLNDAKELIYAQLRNNERGESHDIIIDELAKLLDQAANINEQASNLRQGTQVWHSGPSQFSSKTIVLYEAAWELVLEGILRPGKRDLSCLNERPSGMCLTMKGYSALGIESQ